MTYILAIGDRTYSSWSLRGWLLFEKFGLPVTPRRAVMRTPAFPELLADFFPARTVPAMRTSDGAVIWDSLAIAEELASRHPDAGHWPADPALRGLARALAAEMHAGFDALRGACPMNLAHGWAGFEPGADVLADLHRLQTLWELALDRSGGPWLCGGYTAADAFYAPVAARIAGYGLRVSQQAADYVARHLADRAFRRWRAMALAHREFQAHYQFDRPTAPWPGPEPMAARVAEYGPSENPTCPYSGDPVTDFVAIGDRVFGFCNPFCRDKTLADPLAWPEFAAIYET